MLQISPRLGQVLFPSVTIAAAGSREDVPHSWGPIRAQGGALMSQVGRSDNRCAHSLAALRVLSDSCEGSQISPELFEARGRQQGIR